MSGNTLTKSLVLFGTAASIAGTTAVAAQEGDGKGSVQADQQAGDALGWLFKLAYEHPEYSLPIIAVVTFFLAVAAVIGTIAGVLYCCKKPKHNSHKRIKDTAGELQEGRQADEKSKLWDGVSASAAAAQAAG